MKNLKLQHEIFSPAEKELTREEYGRLLDAAKSKPRLYLLLQTVCATGIRISELRFFTAEALQCGRITVSFKNKNRIVLIPQKLLKALKRYCREKGIAEGVIFRTRSGRPLDRSNIWTEMKKLCGEAHVDAKKVFPHNLRKLFAQCFYRLEHDIAKLADVLGHSSIDTTRIYIMTSGQEHRQLLDRLCLFRGETENTT